MFTFFCRSISSVWLHRLNLQAITCFSYTSRISLVIWLLTGFTQVLLLPWWLYELGIAGICISYRAASLYRHRAHKIVSGFSTDEILIFSVSRRQSHYCREAASQVNRCCRERTAYPELVGTASPRCVTAAQNDRASWRCWHLCASWKTFSTRYNKMDHNLVICRSFDELEQRNTLLR